MDVVALKTVTIKPYIHVTIKSIVPSCEKKIKLIVCTNCLYHFLQTCSNSEQREGLNPATEEQAGGLRELTVSDGVPKRRC